MGNPLVSVVMPIFNGERFMRQAIESVLAQTYESYELIVVNDGSMDGTAEIISSYGTAVRMIAQAKAGVSAARINGIRAARGELVAFLDHDDWWLPEKLAKQVPVFLGDDDVGLVHTGVTHYNDIKQCVVGRLHSLRADLLVGRCYDRLLMGNAIYNSTVIVRKAVLENVGGVSAHIAGNSIQDYDLWLRIARVSSLGYVNEELIVYRLHPAQGLWNRPLLLNEEVRLLEGIVGQSDSPVSKEMRARMSILFDNLGVAQLDSGEKALARKSFAKAISWQWSWRAAIVLCITFFPKWMIAMVRRTKVRLQSLCRPSLTEQCPQWATQDSDAGNGAMKPQRVPTR